MSSRTASTLCTLTVVLWVTAAAAQGPETASVRARLPSLLQVRASAGASMLTSRDQTGTLGFKGGGAQADAQVGVVARSWLRPQLGVLASVYPQKAGEMGGPGGLIAPMAGVAVGAGGDTAWSYAMLDVGPGFTGSYVRATLRAAIGVDFHATPAWSLGPQLGLVQVFNLAGPLQSSDARSLYVALSVRFRRAEPAAEPPTRKAPRPTQRATPLAIHLPPPPPVSQEELTVLLDHALPHSRVELLAPVLFRFDSDDLEPVGVAMLHEVARELGRRDDIELIEIQGYADRRGGSEYNEALSQRRAERVEAWLVAHGVAPERLVVAAHGTADPVEEGDAESSHEQNRRVIFRVLRTRDDDR